MHPLDITQSCSVSINIVTVDGLVPESTKASTSLQNGGRKAFTDSQSHKGDHGDHIGLGNGLVPSGTKPLPKQMLTILLLLVCLGRISVYRCRFTCIEVSII